jgi:hypothetical protein
MTILSFYYGLFKKFRSLGHAAEGTFHGTVPGGSSGVDLSDPNLLLSGSHNGVPLIDPVGTSPSQSPLWLVLNARAAGSGAFSFGGQTWQPMPHVSLGGAAAAAWADFGGMPLVSAFGNWIMAGKHNDFPAFITLPNGGSVPAPLDAGASTPFTCSYASDDGTTGAVPANFWATSLIYLTDGNGLNVTPTTLHSGLEFLVAAVIGNRGDTAVGRYATNPTTMQTPELQAQAWALTFGTGGASPGVQLPSLSNTDPTSVAGMYDVYSLKGGKYEIVGFRFNVTDVFNGIVQAIKDAVTAGTFTVPAPFTPETWVETAPSHVCLRVAVGKGGAWPAYDASPQTERRIAQKNLVVFDADLGPTGGPNILHVKTFTMGGPLKELLAHLQPFDEELGTNVLEVVTDADPQTTKIFLAVPTPTFERWFKHNQARGFTLLRENHCGTYKVPFLDHVLLMLDNKENEIHIPYLGAHVLPLALGVQYDKQHQRAGGKAEVSVVHRAKIPVFGKKRCCYEIETVTIGGFTLETRFHAPKKHPHG